MEILYRVYSTASKTLSAPLLENPTFAHADEKAACLLSLNRAMNGVSRS